MVIFKVYKGCAWVGIRKINDCKLASHLQGRTDWEFSWTKCWGEYLYLRRDDTTGWRILKEDPQTYKCIYLHTMNPEVCQNDSRIWYNKHTKCAEYMELLQQKILWRCIDYFSLKKFMNKSKRSVHTSIFLMLL